LRTLNGPWRYALANALLMALNAVLAYGGGWPLWLVAALATVTGCALDEAVGDDRARLGAGSRLFFDTNLYATLPLIATSTYLMLCLLVGHKAPAGALGGGPPVVTAVLATGYFYAAVGVTVAHELTHRVTSRPAQMWATLLFAFTLNPTFIAYHVHGHHRDVGTYGDPATARRGEYLLAFVARTVVAQSMAGWRLERERLRRKGLTAWSARNRVLGGMLCSLMIVAAAAMIAGMAGVAAFLAAAAIGRIFNEMMNYVQHYGIVRAEGTPLGERHSWDCHRLLSNAVHYNLPRHADHHLFAAKPFWQLEAHAGSPRLPHGYTTMAMIALVPPWWHRTIDPLLADWDERLADDVERSLVHSHGWTTGARNRAGAGPAHRLDASAAVLGGSPRDQTQ